MKPQIFAGLALSVLACAAPALAASGEVGEAARNGLNLTIYGNGLALFDEQRRVRLKKGINTLNILGISPGMIADSARVETGGKLALDEQGFLAANLSARNLLKTYLGRRVEIITTNPKSGKESIREADVLSVNPDIILRIDGRIETMAPGRIGFSQIPATLRPRPVFRISGRSALGGESGLGLSYLSNGFSWRASHALTVDDKSATVRLESRAMLINRSGLDIKAAHIQIVAGTVQRRTGPDRNQRPEAAALRMMKANGAPAADGIAPPARQSLGGFHLYALSGNIDLADQTSKQVTLLAPVTLPVKRRLISESHANPFARLQGAPNPTHPRIRLTLNNDKTAGPGQPIPGGIVRIYGKDAEGRTRFLGEDHLQDLPVGAETSISGGQAFDITVTRHQTDYRRENLGRNTFEMAYRITLTNGGERPETVQVIEAIGGDWSVLEENRKHSRDNNRISWTIDVPAKGGADVTYRVRVRR